MTTSAEATRAGAAAPPRPRALRGLLVTLGPVAAALVLWASALARLDLDDMGGLGLLNALPAEFWAGLAVLTVSFCVALRRPSVPGWALGLHTAVLVLVIHATPSIAYDTVRYAWAWKHTGIVEFIERTGTVDTDVGFLSAYHNWPGFFASATGFTELAGFDHALDFAAWAPPFFNLLLAGVVLALARALTPDRRAQWLAVWFFVAANWVGQDYFAPQPFGLGLYLVLLLLCLRWFRPAEPASVEAIRRWVRSETAAARLQGVLVRADGTVAPRLEASPLERAGVAALGVGIVAVLSSSHQLSPVIALSSLTALVLAQRLELRTLPLLVAATAATWAVFMAAGFLEDNLYWIADSLLTPGHNAESTLIDLGEASDGQRLIAWVDRLLTLGVWALGAAGFARRLRRGTFDLTAGLLAAAPFAALVLSSYGGEILFRVYLFSLPFFALLGALLFYPSQATGGSRRTAALTAVASLLLLGGLAFGYYGKERQNYFSPAEVASSEWLYDTAPAGSTLLAVVNNYPWAFRHYESYAYEDLVHLDEDEIEPVLADPAGYAAGMATDRGADVYVVLGAGQAALVDMTGVLPSGTVGDIERALLRSPLAEVAHRTADAVVFRVRPA